MDAAKTLDAELVRLKAQLAQRDEEAQRLRGELAQRDREIWDLRRQVQQRDAAIQGLQARVSQVTTQRNVAGGVAAGLALLGAKLLASGDKPRTRR